MPQPESFALCTELWKLPVPASALFRGPYFVILPKRSCEISFEIEDESGTIVRRALTFESVNAHKVTYLSSLDPQLVKSAYGRLVDLGNTPWLVEISQRSAAYCTRAKMAAPALRHLAICFDDGPCFEIICAGYKATA